VKTIRFIYFLVIYVSPATPPYPRSSWPFIDRAIAEAITCRLLRAAAKVQSQSRPCGICSGQLTSVSLVIIMPPNALTLSSITRDWYNGPFTACVPWDPKNNEQVGPCNFRTYGGRPRLNYRPPYIKGFNEFHPSLLELV
jgi:hypothetical protein